MSDFKVVGKPVQRLDALGHVTGRTQFFEDVNPTGLLHLKMHRSERHHANLVSVDTSAAEAVKGVVKVLTHKDVPNNWYTVLKLINVGYDDEPVLAEGKVMYLGEPIVAVVATSERAGSASTGVSVTVTTLWRRLRSGGSPTSSGEAPRATRTSGSMSRSPSKASFA